MGIDVHGNARIGVTHQVLQAFQVHTGVGHIGAEGVPEHMGCDLRQGLIRMQLPVLFQCPLEMMLQVHGYFGIAVLVQQQETGIAVDDPFLRGLLSVCNDAFQRFVHIVRHGNESAAAFCFCLLHIIGAVRLANKLMIHPDSAVFKIQLLFGQTTQFADTHSGFQKHHEFIIVATVMFVRLDEVHKDVFLLLG